MKEKVSRDHVALGACIGEIPGSGHPRRSELERRDLLLNEREDVPWHFLDLAEHTDLAISIGNMWGEKSDDWHLGFTPPAIDLHSDHV